MSSSRGFYNHWSVCKKLNECRNTLRQKDILYLLGAALQLDTLLVGLHLLVLLCLALVEVVRLVGVHILPHFGKQIEVHALLGVVP